MSSRGEAAAGRSMWLFGLLALVLAGLLFALLFGAFRPAPPRSVTLLAGAEGGAYPLFGERYRQALAEQGIELRVLPTSGSIENLRRIKTDPSIDLAFVQAGLVNEPESPDLVQLGSMFPEPVWLFHREGTPVTRLTELRGRRIAVGVPGSGTQLLALQMLAASGFDVDAGELRPHGGAEAAEQLRAGELDAAFFVASERAPAVGALLGDPALRLADLEHAGAYRARFGHLEALTLPAGTLDLVSPRPERDLRLLGTSALLVARKDLHPAIISLLMQVAHDIHGDGGLLHRRGDYPAIRDNGLPVAPQAQRFYASGPPLLQRYLPFWLAVLVDRLLVALLPALALLIPLTRIAPPLYAWRMRSRIYRWYGELKFLERELAAVAQPDQAALLDRLAHIEEAANAARVPLAYANELYTLREHVSLVRQKVLARRPGSGTDNGEA